MTEFVLPNNFHAACVADVIAGQTHRLVGAFEWSDTLHGHSHWSNRLFGAYELTDADRLYLRRCLAAFYCVGNHLPRYYYNDVLHASTTYGDSLPTSSWVYEINCICTSDDIPYPTVDTLPQFIERLRWHLAIFDYDAEAIPARPPKPKTFKAKTYTDNELRSLKYRLLSRMFAHIEELPEPASVCHVRQSLNAIRADRRRWLAWSRKRAIQHDLRLPNILAADCLDQIDIVLPSKLGDRPKLTYTSTIDYFRDAAGNTYDLPGQDSMGEIVWRLDPADHEKIISTNYDDGRDGSLHPHQPYGETFHTCGSDAVLLGAYVRGDIVDYLAILDHMAGRVTRSAYDEWRQTTIECGCGCTVESEDDVYHDDDGNSFCASCYSSRMVTCPCCQSDVRVSDIDNDVLRSAHYVQ